VVGVGRRESELAEDVADVPFDGALVDREAAGDDAVGAALGHRGEDVVLAAGALQIPAEALAGCLREIKADPGQWLSRRRGIHRDGRAHLRQPMPGFVRKMT
jgi:hypothetical protein